MLLLGLLSCVFNVPLVLSAGGCFAQQKPGTPQIIGPTILDCYKAIEFIPTDTDKSLAPIIFSHDPKAGYRVWNIMPAPIT